VVASAVSALWNISADRLIWADDLTLLLETLPGSIRLHFNDELIMTSVLGTLTNLALQNSARGNLFKLGVLEDVATLIQFKPALMNQGLQLLTLFCVIPDAKRKLVGLGVASLAKERMDCPWASVLLALIS